MAKAARFHALIEYGGLARTTSKVCSRAVAVEERGPRQRVAVGDVAVGDAVQEQVHPGDGRGPVVQLLAVEAQVAPLLALAPQLGGGGDEHAAGAAGGVVDRLAGLGLQHQRHQVDEGAVGVELLGGVAGVVGELLDQVLVAVAELVLGQVRDRQRLGGEVLDQVLSVASGSRFLLPQSPSPNTPGRVSGLADSIARIAFRIVAPTFSVTLRMSSQWQPSGMAKRWFSGRSASSSSP